MLTHDNQYTLGPFGAVNKTIPVGLPHIEAGSVWDRPALEIDILSALPDGASLEWICCSLDGQCWFGKCAIPNVLPQYNSLCLTLGRDENGELKAVEILILDTAGEAIQTGRDWIVTQRYFLSHGTIGGTPDRVYRVVLRTYPHNLAMAPSVTMPSTVGVVLQSIAAKETNQIFVDSPYAPGRAPYWERLNEPLEGLQILHDYIVPREDKGRVPSGAPQVSRTVWTTRAIRYFVLEPGCYKYAHLQWANTPTGELWSSHWQKSRRNANNELHAVFVMDGEIYVRTKNLFGTGKIVRNYINESGEFADEVIILCMADYGIWRKNYPDFDWDKACLGKIGKCKVLFECSEDERHSLELGIMRYSATGNYIPVVDKVDWADNPYGDNAAKNPPMLTLTGPEAGELALYLSSVVNQDLNAAIGVCWEKNFVKFFSLDETGAEVDPPSVPPATKGANPWIMPGHSPVAGAMGPMLVSKDKNTVFVTDVEHALHRRLFDLKGLGVGISRQAENATATTKEVTERAILIGTPNNLTSAISFESIFDCTSEVNGQTEDEEYSAMSSAFSRHDITPIEINMVKATGGYTGGNGIYHNGVDEYASGLPAWNFPILINMDRPAETTTYYREEIGRYTDSDGQEHHEFRYRFAWINPVDGTITPTTHTALDPEHPGPLVVEYTPTTGLIRFGEGVADTSKQSAHRLVNAFSIPAELTGWVGCSDHFYLGPTLSGGGKTYSSVGVYSGMAARGKLGITYTPLCEFYEQLSTFSMYYVYDASREDRCGTVYTYDGYIGRDEIEFVFPAWDIGIHFGYSLAKDGIARYIWDNIMDSVWLSSNSYSTLFNPSRSHNVPNTYWGVDEVTKAYPVTTVCMAHYVHHDSMFHAKPFVYRDAQYTQEEPAYRYLRQVNVMKCRKGEHDQYSTSVMAPWADHAMMMFEILADKDKYDALCAPLAIRNPDIV